MSTDGHLKINSRSCEGSLSHHDFGHIFFCSSLYLLSASVFGTFKSFQRLWPRLGRLRVQSDGLSVDGLKMLDQTDSSKSFHKVISLRVLFGSKNTFSAEDCFMEERYPKSILRRVDAGLSTVSDCQSACRLNAPDSPVSCTCPGPSD